MRVWGLLILVSILVMAGCATIHPREPVGTGTYSYLSGSLSWTYPVSMEVAWQATLKALQDLKLQLYSKNLDGLGGHIEALRADKTKVNIQLKPASDRSTRISVRIGTFGSREGSRKIHQTIRTHLKL